MLTPCSSLCDKELIIAGFTVLSYTSLCVWIIGAQNDLNVNQIKISYKTNLGGHSLIEQSPNICYMVMLCFILFVTDTPLICGCYIRSAKS